jgi:hypothetical protein
MGFLFGGGGQSKAEPVARMPASNDAVVRASRARQRKDILGRGGRSSTVLTQQPGTGGTQSYTNSLLGSA